MHPPSSAGTVGQKLYKAHTSKAHKVEDGQDNHPNAPSCVSNSEQMSSVQHWLHRVSLKTNQHSGLPLGIQKYVMNWKDLNSIDDLNVAISASDNGLVILLAQHSLLNWPNGAEDVRDGLG